MLYCFYCVFSTCICYWLVPGNKTLDYIMCIFLFSLPAFRLSFLLCLILLSFLPGSLFFHLAFFLILLILLALTLYLYSSTQNALKKLLPLRALKQTTLTAFSWRSFIKFIFICHSYTCRNIWVTLLKYFFVIGNFPIVLYYLFCHGKSSMWSFSWVLERKKKKKLYDFFFNIKRKQKIRTWISHYILNYTWLYYNNNKSRFLGFSTSAMKVKTVSWGCIFAFSSFKEFPVLLNPVSATWECFVLIG